MQVFGNKGSSLLLEELSTSMSDSSLRLPMQSPSLDMICLAKCILLQPDSDLAVADPGFEKGGFMRM